jgi:hypothetical protein
LLNLPQLGWRVHLAANAYTRSSHQFLPYAFWVTSIFDMTHVLPHNLRPCVFAQHTAGMRKLRKYPLSLELAESESLQKLFVNIRGQIGFRVCRRDVCNRRVYFFAYRSCPKGVDVARMRPAEHRGHARDLFALVDLVSHGCEEVGTRGKQRVKVGHHTVLVDEGMGPVEAGVQGASHYLAAAVDAGGYGGKISRQSVEVCECAVQPKRGILGCIVIMKFENVSSQKSGRSLVIDFWMISIHTGLYVMQSREEASLIIGRGNTTSHDHQGLLRNAIRATEQRWIFIFLSAC